MRPNSVLISKIREMTDNSNFSDLSGIQDSEILEYLNDAQDRIYSKITKAYSNIYLSESTQDVSNGQEYVDLPSESYLGYRIVKVEFKGPSSGGYQYLKKGSLPERFTTESGYPAFYLLLDKQILLQPKANRTGTVRFTYQRRLPNLDISRGDVSAVTLGSDSITSLTLDSGTLVDENITEMLNAGYITVCDIDGIVQMKKIPISAINSTTGVVTVRAGFTFDSGETIAVGDVVCAGKNSTIVSQLPDDAERYLKSYADWKLYRRDSSSDSNEQSQELVTMEQDIVESFAEASQDVEYPTILDTQFLESVWF